MNLVNKNTAKIHIFVIFLVVLTLLTNKVHAQKEYTTISKNINPDARALYHDLSANGDSLYLKYESIFYKVTFLNSLDRKVYKYNPPAKEAKISLHELIVGDYTVLIYGKDRIIVFHISRLLEIENLKELVVIKERPLAQLMTAEISKIKTSLNEITMNQIANDNIMDYETDELNVALNDDNLNAVQPIYRNTIKFYNLSDVYREGMQTREDYRRNNLRPNGKLYH
ncbi:MAG: hypothetical protein ABIO60_01485 [Aquaticitalea sp.]